MKRLGGASRGMTEMVERVARAAYEAMVSAAGEAPTWDSESETLRRDWRVTALAAIAAMGEPTAAMLATGELAEDAAGEPVGEIGAGAAWSAMVEEALR